MNLFVDSMGIYTLYNGSNGTACVQSLRNRWNVTGTGGSIYAEANRGARGNPGLTLGFGGAIAKTFPHRSTYILGIRFAMTSLAGVGGGSSFIDFFNNNQPLCTLQILNDGSIKVYGNGVIATVILTTGIVISPSTLTYLDLKATISGITAMTLAVEVFVNGVSLGTGSSLIGRDASTLTNRLATFNRIFLSSGVATNGQSYISDLYLNDNLGGINDVPIANPLLEIDPYPLPNADGSKLDWQPDTGSIHYNRVNENPPDGDSTYLKSSNIGDIDSWGWEDLVRLTDSINAVQLTYFARTTDEGNRSFQGTIGLNGADGQTQTFGLNNDYTHHHQSFDLNPAGNVPWTPPVFNADEFGIELIA